MKRKEIRVVQDWGQYLGDATMASTILDRLMHLCVMLVFEGKSYRLKEAAARLAINLATSYFGCAAWGNLGWPRVGKFGLAIWVWACGDVPDQNDVARLAAASR